MPPLQSSVSGLPRPFLDAMKRLFDILDVDGTGWIPLQAISDHWQPNSISENEFSHMPRNVVESLRKVSTADGRLSFERMCGGLKIAILRHEAEKNRVIFASEEKKKKPLASSPAVRSPDASSEESPISRSNRSNSLPNLGPAKVNLVPFSFDLDASPPSPVRSEPGLRAAGPPKPPRDPHRMSGIFSRPDIDAHTYENVKFGSLPRESEEHRRKSPKRNELNLRRHSINGSVDSAVWRRLKQWEDEKVVLEEGLATITKAREYYERRVAEVEAKINVGREMGTAMSHLEAQQERIIFELQSIRDLNERLRSLASCGGRSSTAAGVTDQAGGGSPVQLVAASNEAARGGAGGGGAPATTATATTTATAVRGGATDSADEAYKITMLERQIERLKMQNKQLTEEVGTKSNQITNLEQEKSALIRQLFQARSNGNVVKQQPSALQMQKGQNSGSDSTFMM